MSHTSQNQPWNVIPLVRSKDQWFFFPTFCKCQTGFFGDGSGVKFAIIMSFVLSKFVATEEFVFFGIQGIVFFYK
jgi:hypothetical protein